MLTVDTMAFSGQSRMQLKQSMQLRSISGRNVTTSYPELAPMGAAVGIEALIDGEIVVFDGDRPSFAHLQHRMHVSQPTAFLVETYPVVFIAFDLLALDGRSLLDLPYSTRRRFLAEIVNDGPSWRCPPASTEDGASLLELARARDLEGVVAKRLSSHYEPGVRSRHWVKVKIRKRQEFVVGGFLPGRDGGALDGQIGYPFTAADRLVVDTHPHPVRLVRVNGLSFFEVLRRKLRWGER